jgi:peptidoglycan/LPS O-acetylase OafA/YrhL
MLLATISVLPRTSPAAAARLGWLYDLAESPWTCLALAGAVYVLVLTPAGGPYDLSVLNAWQALGKEVLYGVFAVLFLLPGFLGDQHRGLPRRFLSSVPMRKLGEASYGIFLFHMEALYFVFQVMHLSFPGYHFWRVLVEVIAISVPVAFVSLYVIERPALRLKRFILRRPAASSAAAPGSGGSASADRVSVG